MAIGYYDPYANLRGQGYYDTGRDAEIRAAAQWDRYMNEARRTGGAPGRTRNYGIAQQQQAAAKRRNVAQTNQGPPQDDLDMMLAQSYLDSFNEAKGANERRYQNILGGYTDRHARAMLNLQGMGDAERRRMDTKYNRDYHTSQNALRGNITGLGLSGTSRLGTMLKGDLRDTREDYFRDTGNLDERLRRERLGYDERLAADQLRFQERRTDSYPDYAQMLQLSQMMGQGRGGQVNQQFAPPPRNERYGYNNQTPIFANNPYGGGVFGNVNQRQPQRQQPQRQRQPQRQPAVGRRNAGYADQMRDFRRDQANRAYWDSVNARDPLWGPPASINQAMGRS